MPPVQQLARRDDARRRMALGIVGDLRQRGHRKRRVAARQGADVDEDRRTPRPVARLAHDPAPMPVTQRPTLGIVACSQAAFFFQSAPPLFGLAGALVPLRARLTDPLSPGVTPSAGCTKRNLALLARHGRLWANSRMGADPTTGRPMPKGDDLGTAQPP